MRLRPGVSSRATERGTGRRSRGERATSLVLGIAAVAGVASFASFGAWRDANVLRQRRNCRWMRTAATSASHSPPSWRCCSSGA